MHALISIHPFLLSLARSWKVFSHASSLWVLEALIYDSILLMTFFLDHQRQPESEFGNGRRLIRLLVGPCNSLSFLLIVSSHVNSFSPASLWSLLPPPRCLLVKKKAKVNIGIGLAVAEDRDGGVVCLHAQ